MVEISYGEHYDLADLTGRSIAEVREQYKTEFEIPDQAQAILNDKPLKKKLEDRTSLEDGDELSFEERERSKKPVFVTALMLALAITGGLFAYTWTTASATLSVTPATSDFASVAANTTGIANVTWQPFGRYRGTIPAGNLFDVTPTTGYNGDLEVTVYLANPDELSSNYRAWLLRLQLIDGSNPVDAQMGTQVLSLNNAEASFYWPSANYTPGTTYYVRCTGGSYVGLPWVGTGWPSTYDPLLFVQVTQAGLKSTP
jgi:hypothetical protein